MIAHAPTRNHRTSQRTRQVADLLERRIPALSWIERDDLAEEIGRMLDESYREGCEDTRDDLASDLDEIATTASLARDRAVQR